MSISIKEQSKKGTSHPLYRIWYLMIYRCNNPKYYKYHRYGGRGIKVCEEWYVFDKFINDMYSSYSLGMTLDRRDNDGNYDIKNCQWLTRAENSKKDMSKGINKYTLTGDYLDSFIAMSDANASLGLKKNHGGMSRALRLQKPFKGFRWARKEDKEPLLSTEMKGTLINTNVSVNQIDLETCEVIKVWKNSKAITKALGISSGTISNVCKGRTQQAKGFNWEYVNNPNKLM